MIQWNCQGSAQNGERIIGDFIKKNPLHGCCYGMGASLTNAQARRRFARMGDFALCGIAKTPYFENQHAAQIILCADYAGIRRKIQSAEKFSKKFLK
ncbi:MAG: hypothetical protein IK134_06945 [Oscillospiraceae bacterium]|nr:hypothetical protein [Oscillospiraceae bacterium]